MWQGSQLRSFRLLTEHDASRVRIPLARNIFSRDGKLKKRNYICFSAFVCEETQGIFCFDFLLPNYLRRNVRFKASL